MADLRKYNYELHHIQEAQQQYDKQYNEWLKHYENTETPTAVAVTLGATDTRYLLKKSRPCLFTILEQIYHDDCMDPGASDFQQSQHLKKFLRDWEKPTSSESES